MLKHDQALKDTFFLFHFKGYYSLKKLIEKVKYQNIKAENLTKIKALEDKSTISLMGSKT